MADLTGRVLGDYVLREKVGGGGYGEVYRAEHRELRRVAVVKVMNEERRWKDEAAAARFRREAQLAAQLRHPNAAHVYDFGVSAADEGDREGVMWIAMEFVDGCSFSDWLDVHGPMSLGEAVQFFKPLLEAVHAAHQCGIVHRDLKPSNVMVVENNGVPVPKLIDFGIAKGTVASLAEDEPVEHPGDKVTTDLIRAARSPLYHHTETGETFVPEHRREITRSGAGFGSRAYMSPEQWGDAARVGPAADIYSLGVMLCEALTGRLPFKAEDTDGYLRMHFHAVPDIYLPEDLGRVLYRALAKEPEQRQANALELAAELREALKADPNEQIRSLAQRWHERGRSPDLLARGQTLMELKRSVQSPRVAAHLSKLDDSFIALSLQRARRAKWAIGALVALVVMGGLLVRAEKGRRMADEFATESEVERGQQALLHGDSTEAVIHLEKAYQDGERSSGVKFMLARALQPRTSELGRLTSIYGRMWSAAFSPDDKRIVTSDDKGARMWDAGSNQLLFTMAHGDSVYRTLFSPDGSQIITAGADGTVRIWSAETGALLRMLTSQRSTVKQWRAVAMSSHYVGAMDMKGRTAHVWDADTGKQIAELNNGMGEVASLAFSADGHWLATSGDEGVRIFNTSTWTRAAMIVTPRVRSMSFDPVASYLAVGTYDGEASIWEVPSGTCLRYLRQTGESVDAIAFSREGELIAVGSREGAEQVWDVATGAQRAQFYSHRGEIYAVEFAPMGDLLLSAGADGTVVVSNVATGSLVSRLEGPESLVLTAHFDSAARRVVGASLDGTARIWDASAPYLRWALPPIGAECDTAESLVPDQRFVALSCRNHGTHVWDTSRGELIAELPEVTPVDGDYYSALPAVTVTGDRAAVARGNTVRIYALPSGQLLRTTTHPAAVNAVAFATAGRDLISGAIDGSVLLTRDGSEPIGLPSSSAAVDAVALLADGRAVVADASNRLRVIELSRHVPLMDVVAPMRMRLLRPSPDGTRLVTLSIRNRQAAPVLWDFEQYRLLAKLDGHAERVFTARFAGDGHEILTAARDGVRLWNARTGSLRRSFRGDSSFLADATMAPDGSMVIAGGSDGLLRFWDTSTGRLLWTLRAHKSYVIGVHYEGEDIVTRGFAGELSRWRLAQPSGIIEACLANACATAEK